MTRNPERGVNTMLEKAKRFLRALFAPTVIVTHTARISRPMTAAEIAAMDRAFAKFNEGFDEMSKAFTTEGAGE